MAIMEAQTADEENTIQLPLLDNADDRNAVAGESTLNSEEEEEEELPDLPLEPYKTYAKFTCRVVKWILPLCIFNIVVWNIFYEAYGEPWGDSWQAGVYVINAVFFFFAARAIDRDVAKVDEEFQTQVESGNGEPPMDWNNYENIYGKVARKMDIWLISACRTHRVSTEERPSGTTSFLSHFCWITWAMCFASAFGLTLDLPFQEKLPSVGGDTVTNTSSIFSNISHFPPDIQSWITNAQGNYLQLTHFPTNGQFNINFPHPMLNDRELLPGGHDKDFLEDMYQLYTDDKHVLTELVAVDNRLEKRVHEDILSAHLFIPVQNSMDKNNSWHAGVFCFLSIPDGKPRSFQSCRDEAHCVDSSKMENGQELIMNNATLDWHMTKIYSRSNKCNRHSFDVAVASYKDLVLFHRARYSRCHEVIQLNPATMETSTIYHKKCAPRGETDFNHRRPLNYLQFFSGICGLSLAAYYLIQNMGMASGVVPLALALAYVLFELTDTGFYIIFLTAATGFLHYSIYTDHRWGRLPVWVGKDFYIWALYGMLASVWHLPFVTSTRYGLSEDLQFVYLLLSGILLGHPVFQTVGCILMIASGIDFMVELDEEALEDFFTGLGLWVFGNWFSSHKEVICSRTKFMVQYLVIRFRCRRRFRRRFR